MCVFVGYKCADVAGTNVSTLPITREEVKWPYHKAGIQCITISKDLLLSFECKENGMLGVFVIEEQIIVSICREPRSKRLIGHSISDYNSPACLDTFPSVR